jgi:hypothetical protein
MAGSIPRTVHAPATALALTDRPRRDPVFAALSAVKRTMDGLHRAARYDFPHPDSRISVSDLDQLDEVQCIEVADATRYALPTTEAPMGANTTHGESYQVAIASQAIFSIGGGRVYGEGHAILPDNCLVDGFYPSFDGRDRHWLLGLGNLPPPTRVAGSVAVLSSPGSSNYYHWTLEAPHRLHVLRNNGIHADWYYAGTKTQFQRDWLSKMDIPIERVLPADAETHIQADTLIMTTVPRCHGVYNQSTYETLERYFPSPPPNTDRRLYISRGCSRRRRIVNEAAVVSALHSYGYEVHTLGEKRIEEQAEMFASASHIVAAHGAELTNLVYCRPYTRVVEILSPSYINPCYWAIATQKGLNYSSMLGSGYVPSSKSKYLPHRVWCNIKVPVSELVDRLSSIHSSESADGHDAGVDAQDATGHAKL